MNSISIDNDMYCWFIKIMYNLEESEMTVLRVWSFQQFQMSPL